MPTFLPVFSSKEPAGAAVRSPCLTPPPSPSLLYFWRLMPTLPPRAGYFAHASSYFMPTISQQCPIGDRARLRFRESRWCEGVSKQVVVGAGFKGAFEHFQLNSCLSLSCVAVRPGSRAWLGSDGSGCHDQF